MILRQIERRPLVLCCLALLIGLLALDFPWLVFLLVPALMKRWALAVRIGVTVSFLVGLALHAEPVRPLDQRVWVQGTARVASVAREGVDVTTFDLEMKGLRLRATASPEIKVGLGDVIRTEGVARPPTEAAQAIYAAEGLQGRLDLSAGRVEVLSRGPWGWADAWRRSFARFTASLPEEEAHLLQALTFRSPTLDQEETGQLKRTGTVHLVAASGVHVMAIAALVLFVFSKLPILRLQQIGLSSLVLMSYAAATGAHPPTVRAVIMTLAFLLAYRLRREPDGLSALAFAAIVCLIWNPRSVYQLGFQLSMVVVGALVLFPPRYHFPSTVIRRTYELSHVSLVAALAAEPILALSQHSISWTTIPANLFAVSAACAAIASGIAGQAVGMLFPWLGKAILGWFAYPCLKWVEAVVAAFDTQAASIPIPAFSYGWVLLFYLAFLVSWKERYVEA